jgi:hypothetical protein
VAWVCGANVTLQVSAASNNAFQSGEPGTVTISDSTDTMTNAIGELLGFRFPSATIANVPIVQANLWLYFTATGTGSVGLACEKSTSSAAFTTSDYNISNRTLTAAGTSWSVGGLSSGWNASADISPAVIEVINQQGWTSGDTVTVIVGNNPISSSISVEMYDGSATEAAILAVFTGTNPVFAGRGVGMVSVGGGGVQGGAVGMAATW